MHLRAAKLRKHRHYHISRKTANRLRLLLLPLPLPLLLIFSSGLWAGSYTDSAHGANDNGVFRSVIGSTPPAGFGYARGNCAHCHEQHASIEGSEPAPTGGPNAYALFAVNFKDSAQENQYAEADNFCFYCHNSSGSAQQVTNYNYSRNFGCDALGPNSILEAVNQTSYHNLYDIWSFAKGEFSWFRDKNNPCAACHNPHLARRNWANPRNPAYSAISTPGDHFSLWGTTQTMDTAYPTQYEPPLCSSSGTDREPAGSADAAAGRENTPDYIGFCTECHNNTNTIYSNTLNRDIKQIDWSASGDKHGSRIMDGVLDIKSPYTSSSGGYVLSCTDCHEPHGSPNVMLIRTRVNGENLEGPITRFDQVVEDSNVEWSYLCRRCHKDDYENDYTGMPGYPGDTGNQNAWQYVHHFADDAPYPWNNVKGSCPTCHGLGGNAPKSCDKCHYHGAIISEDVIGLPRRAF
ncbi:MAG: hypothetical protein SCH71_06285 [Desulfobulbaceae bacterium]|nr:hypothetical protein [Desulfobulbaceae bacterium]